jgi:hypothetical protein
VERRERRLEPLALVVGEERDACREPRRPSRSDALEERLPRRCELEPDATAVAGRADACQEGGGLQAVDVAG